MEKASDENFFHREQKYLHASDDPTTHKSSRVDEGRSREKGLQILYGTDGPLVRALTHVGQHTTQLCRDVVSHWNGAICTGLYDGLPENHRIKGFREFACDG